MFRGFMPALTLLIFTAGVGIGFAWTQGLIPLSIAPANSGTLSVEVTEREPLPPPPGEHGQSSGEHAGIASLEPPRDDAVTFQPQTEPVVDNPRIANIEQPQNSLPAPTTSTMRNVKSSSAESVVQSGLSDDPPANASRVRTRDRNPVRLDADAEIEEATEPQLRRAANTAVRQASTENEDDGTETDKDKSIASKSPNELLAAAEEKLAAGETLVAHRELSQIYWNHKDFRPRLQEVIDSTARSIFFQPKPHYVEPYVVREGDRLETIAKKYQLSWEYLAKLNRTDPRRVQLAQKLKVMKGPFGAVIDQRDFTLTIHLQGYYVKSYLIGIGKDGSSPTGKLTVLAKQENPQYTDSRTGQVTQGGDPSNPLGSRWIDLGDSFGIHGTTDPKSIGKAESRGCFRLRDDDIIDVYNFLVKGSEVVIRK